MRPSFLSLALSRARRRFEVLSLTLPSSPPPSLARRPPLSSSSSPLSTSPSHNLALPQRRPSLTSRPRRRRLHRDLADRARHLWRESLLRVRVPVPRERARRPHDGAHDGAVCVLSPVRRGLSVRRVAVPLLELGVGLEGGETLTLTFPLSASSRLPSFRTALPRLLPSPSSCLASPSLASPRLVFPCPLFLASPPSQLALARLPRRRRLVRLHLPLRPPLLGIEAPPPRLCQQGPLPRVPRPRQRPERARHRRDRVRGDARVLKGHLVRPLSLSLPEVEQSTRCARSELTRRTRLSAVRGSGSTEGIGAASAMQLVRRASI